MNVEYVVLVRHRAQLRRVLSSLTDGKVPNHIIFELYYFTDHLVEIWIQNIALLSKEPSKAAAAPLTTLSRIQAN